MPGPMDYSRPPGFHNYNTATPRKWAFFKTVAGPDDTEYPEDDGTVTTYYARRLRDVEFPQAAGSGALTYELTDDYVHIFNLESEKYIESGKVILGFLEDGYWYTIDKAAGGAEVMLVGCTPRHQLLAEIDPARPWATAQVWRSTGTGEPLEFAWSHDFATAVNLNGGGLGAVIDDDQNVYFCGGAFGFTGSTVAKCDRDGNVLWTFSASRSQSVDICLAPDAGVWVVSHNSDATSFAIVHKLDVDGNLLATINLTSRGGFATHRVCCDPDGNLYLAEASVTPTNRGRLSKYHPIGMLAWSYDFPAPVAGRVVEQPRGLFFDAGSNQLYVGLRGQHDVASSLSFSPIHLIKIAARFNTSGTRDAGYGPAIDYRPTITSVQGSSTIECLRILRAGGSTWFGINHAGSINTNVASNTYGHVLWKETAGATIQKSIETSVSFADSRGSGAYALAPQLDANGQLQSLWFNAGIRPLGSHYPADDPLAWDPANGKAMRLYSVSPGNLTQYGGGIFGPRETTLPFTYGVNFHAVACRTFVEGTPVE